MSKFNFNGAVIKAENITFNENPFNWKFFNSFLGRKTAEYHYKCQNTGAFKCKEYKIRGEIISTTYSLPNSEDYSIKSEEELITKILGGKEK